MNRSRNRRYVERIYIRDQQGRLNRSNGGFRRAPAELFPVDTLNTVGPRKGALGDLNGDGLPDMFIAAHGWDTEPFAGEQNRLYLSRPGGGWRDATSELPRLALGGDRRYPRPGDARHPRRQHLGRRPEETTFCPACF